jgi:hypothetical protein
VLELLLTLIRVKFLAKEHEPVLLEDATFLLLLEDLTLVVEGVLALTAGAVAGRG